MNKIIPKVTVIITSRNEEVVIKRLIKSVKTQSYKNIEVILVDNNSTDQTKQIAKKFKIDIYNIGPERSSQRNFGAKISKGKYLLFLDADMKLSRHVIKECVELMVSDKKIKLIVIPERSIATDLWEKVKAYERYFYNLEGDSITDAARFFEKKIFFLACGFDETITGPEDWDLPERIKKMGIKSGRVKSTIDHFERIPSLYHLARKKFYYALLADRYFTKNSIPIFGPKAIYFLRPVFYKNWRILISNPILTFEMVIMLSIELFSGALGYLLGKYLR